MAITHLTDDAQIEAYLDARPRDPALLEHVRGCNDCLARVRAARRDRLLVRAALEQARVRDDHVAADTLAAFCDERLDEAATHTLAAHLARCETCREHYLDLLAALSSTAPAAVAGRDVDAAQARRSPPAHDSYGALFITRFAGELRIAFVAARTAGRPGDWAYRMERSGGRPDEPVYLDRLRGVRARQAPAATRRVELRSRSMSDTLRGLAARTAAPSPPPRPRPQVQFELPRALVAVELVDLHEGEVEFAVRVVRSLSRDPAARLRLTVTAPGRESTTVTLAPRVPSPIGPFATPAMLYFDDGFAHPAAVEVRNLVAREPAP